MVGILDIEVSFVNYDNQSNTILLLNDIEMRGMNELEKIEIAEHLPNQNNARI